MLASAALCWAVALMLQPLRARLDTESSARYPIRLSDVRTTITAVLAVRELRSLSLACFAFNGTQAVFVAYFVTYMTSQGHPLVAAGSLYSTVIAVAVPGRILWAWVGGFYVPPHLVLGGLAFGMAVSIGLMGAFTPHWPLLAIGAVTMVVSATALSWHGIMLSEAARLAPPGRVGAVTGGVLSFGQIGALSSPAVFSLLLGLSGGYSAGWVLGAVPAVLVRVNMFHKVSTCSSVIRCDLRTAVVTASPDSISRITWSDVTALITLCKPVTMADNWSNKQEVGHASHRRSGSSLRSKSSRPAVGQSLARARLRHRRRDGRCDEQCRCRRCDHGLVVQRL